LDTFWKQLVGGEVVPSLQQFDDFIFAAFGPKPTLVDTVDDRGLNLMC